MFLRWRSLFGIFIAFVLIFPFATPLSAQEGTPAAENPAILMSLRGDNQTDGERIVAEIDPGKSSDVTIWMGNYGPEMLPVISFTADLYTKINGGLGMNSESDERHGQTTWIDFPTKEFDIEPLTEMSRTFTVKVPKDTPPGEYVIPLAMETLNAYAVSPDSPILQKIRKVLTLYVIVSGDYQAAFSLGDPTVEFVENVPAIDVPIHNQAQTTIRLTGQMTVHAPDGSLLLDAPLGLSAIYGLAETLLRLRLPSLPPAGDYTISVTLTDQVSGVSATIDNALLVMPEAPSDEVAPLTFGTITIVPNADPIQFAAISIEVSNTGATVRSARLTLIVTKDGQPLEDFVLADNVTVNQGISVATQRYLPLTGWESGSYGFSLKLESVDTSTGATTLLLSQDNVATIDVP